MSGGPLDILVIDDHQPIAKAIGSVLEQDGHRVSVVTSGERGVEAVTRARDQGRPYAVVITDFSMADLDGLAVAAAIKSIAPSTAVILMTAYRLDEAEALPQVDGILPKPPRLTELRALLARLPMTASCD